MADESTQAPEELQRKLAEFLKSDNFLSLGQEILGQEILDILPAAHERRHEVLEILANALHDHYKDSNEWSALETAFEYLEEIITNTDDDDDAAVARLSHTYSQCLHSRFMRGRNEQDLESAIAFAENSVEKTKRTLPAEEHSGLLTGRRSNVAFCLFTKAHQTDECPLEVLDNAIAIAEELYRAVQKPDVGNQVFWMWSKTSDIICGSDGTKDMLSTIWIDLLHLAIGCATYCQQRAFKCYLNDGSSLSDAHLPQGMNLQEAALEFMTHALGIKTDYLSTNLENTMTFVVYIRELPVDARGPMLARMFPVLKKCIELFQDITLISLRDDQRDFVGTFYGLSRYAATAALEAGAGSVQALQLLESGRATAMSNGLDANRDGADLQITDPVMGELYMKARYALTQSAAQSESFDERYEKLRRFRELQEHIRTQPGLADYDRPMGEEAMKELAAEGVIVVLNVTDLRCDAIIVTTDCVSAFPLPDLDEEELSEKSWIIQTYLAKTEDRDEFFVDLWETLSSLLNLLWTQLAEPVLNQLGYKPRKLNWPHVWWVPTGVLSLYPIHAAGTGLNKSRTVMNRVISSYTPTLKALGQSRSKHARQAGRRTLPPNSALDNSSNSSVVTIVTMQKTPCRVDLDFSDHEAKVVQSYFPNAMRLHEPTGDSVLALLQASEENKAPSLVHFSCHGETDYENPSQSMLLMTDWQTRPLTVKQLQSINMPSSELVFLSACFAANGGIERLQDEAEHLSSAMQVAGFNGVVGSLWDVGQDVAYAVVQDFYKHLAEDGVMGFNAKRAARALHMAVLKLRQKQCVPANDMKGNPVLWAPFVHFGI